MSNSNKTESPRHQAKYQAENQANFQGAADAPVALGFPGQWRDASPAEIQKWEAYLLQVKGDLRQHLAVLDAMLAEPEKSVDLSPETISELNLVRSMIDIYASRSQEDLEDSRTGFSGLDLR